jgi:tyrosyl-tRNA synthetase
MKSLKKPSKEEAITRLLDRGVEEIINRGHLEQALRLRKKLRVKLGIDSTRPDLHLGHAVVLRKLREFQNLGHQVVLIIGDFTATIGDPSGRSAARQPISEKEAVLNAKDYLKQAGKILDIKKAEIRHNSEWHKKEGLASMLKLASAASIQQVLERADFKKRLGKGETITVLEALYPLLQGYDSVKVRADVELGGADQKFNLLMGRHIQRFYGMAEQDVMTLPLLEGTDGAKKMSKSYDNYIGLDDSAQEMFGKIMSIPDELIAKYFILCTDVAGEEIIQMEKEMASGGLNPRDAKARSAFEIVKIYHGEGAAKKTEEEFDRVFQRKELPEKVETFRVDKPEMPIVELLVLAKFATSKSEARRLIVQGGVKINQEKIIDTEAIIGISEEGVIIQVGSRRFAKLTKEK